MFVAKNGDVCNIGDLVVVSNVSGTGAGSDTYQVCSETAKYFTTKVSNYWKDTRKIAKSLVCCKYNDLYAMHEDYHVGNYPKVSVFTPIVGDSTFYDNILSSMQAFKDNSMTKFCNNLQIGDWIVIRAVYGGKGTQRLVIARIDESIDNKFKLSLYEKNDDNVWNVCGNKTLPFTSLSILAKCTEELSNELTACFDL